MIAKLIASSHFNDTVVTAEDVANAIVQQLYLGRGAQLVVPSTLGWVSAVRGFPLWLQMNMRDHISVSLLRATELMKP
jgi:all-trans-retinol dehydrogenase (NAD+)